MLLTLQGTAPYPGTNGQDPLDLVDNEKYIKKRYVLEREA